MEVRLRQVGPSPERLPSAAGFLLVAAAAAVFPLDRVLSGLVASGHGIAAICAWLGLTQDALLENVIRLGLPTPHGRPLRGGGRHGWSVRETTCLIFWRVSGVHPDTIAARLGRSVGAVRAKCRRLGIQAPPRKSLRKCDPAALPEPEPGFGLPTAAQCARARQANCGRLAGPVSVRGGASAPAFSAHDDAASDDAASVVVPARQGDDLSGIVRSTVAPPPKVADEPIPRPRGRARGTRATNTQRELPLDCLIDGTLGRQEGVAPATPPQPPFPAPAPPLAPVPQQEADVAMNDLAWIGQIKRPLQNRLAVWAMSLLYFGQVHYKEIARRIGRTECATGSLLHRCWLPRDRDRRKFGVVFDEEMGRATLAASGYELARDEQSGEWYWRHKRDRATVRQNRGRRRAMGLLKPYTSEEITLLTRGAMGVTPFAHQQVMMRA